MLAYIRKAFNWHASRDDNFVSPIVPGMIRVKPADIERKRMLSDDEIRDFWAALDAVHPVYAQVAKILLMTGQRLREIGQLRYDEIDPAVAYAIAPPERTKSKNHNVIPFTPFVAAIIKDRFAAKIKTSEYVFWARGGGRSPFQGWSGQKRALDEAVNKVREQRGPGAIEPWRLHDLRRAARSLMSRVKVDTEISERVLSHVMPRMQRVYDRFEYFDEKMDALNRLEREILAIVNQEVRTIQRG